MNAYRVHLTVRKGTYQVTVHDESGAPVAESVVGSTRELVAIVARGGDLSVWCTEPRADPLPSAGDRPT